MFGLMNGIAGSGHAFRAIDGGRGVVEMHPGAFGIVAGILGIILWVLAVVALVLAIVTMVRNFRHREPKGSVPPAPAAMVAPRPAPAAPSGSSAPVDQGTAVQPEPGTPAATALQILNDRFARGEISQEEYLERRKTLIDG